TEIERAGGKARAIVADVSNSAAVRKMFADFLGAFGTIDVLINNAGIGRTREASEVIPTQDKTDEEWHKMLATHLDSTFYCTREALKVMIPKKSGRIINLGSIAGTTGLAFASDYCAAKGGIISFTKSVAREVVGHGILVNCIAPGFIDTPMTAPIEGELRQMIIAQTPIGRFGDPSDIAAAALFLAIEDSKFMVGQVISPNGGYVI
ncbi:MAG TPA: SDR family NAD(P)-dependent oxidoreductase, partial [Candidatus Binataceae bacterium]